MQIYKNTTMRSNTYQERPTSRLMPSLDHQALTKEMTTTGMWSWFHPNAFMLWLNRKTEHSCCQSVKWNEPSYMLCMTIPQLDTWEETKRYRKSKTNTGGQECMHGSLTTSKDVQFASKVRTSHIENAPPSIAFPPSQTHTPSKPSQWTWLLGCCYKKEWTQSSR